MSVIAITQQLTLLQIWFIMGIEMMGTYLNHHRHLRYDDTKWVPIVVNYVSCGPVNIHGFTIEITLQSSCVVYCLSEKDLVTRITASISVACNFTDIACEVRPLVGKPLYVTS